MKHINKRSFRILSLLLCYILISFNTGNMKVKADDLSETRRQINQVVNDISLQEKQLSDLAEDLAKINGKIEDTKKEISELNSQIEVLKEDKKEIVADLNLKNEKMDERLKDKYIRGHQFELALILNATSFSDLFMRTRVLKEILSQDQQIINNVNEAKIKKQELENQLTRTLEKKDENLKSIVAEQGKTKELIAKQSGIIEKLKNKKIQLGEMLKSQELELFAEAKRILDNENSSKDDLNFAKMILANASFDISTDEAVQQLRLLSDRANTLAEKIAENERVLKEAEDARLKAEAEAELQRLQAEAEKAKADIIIAKDKVNENPVVAPVVAEPTQPVVQPEPVKDPVIETPIVNIPVTTTNPAVEEVTFQVTVYTDLADEGSGTGITASGLPVGPGVAANNVLPLGTKIYVEGLGNYTILDRGGYEFYSKTRVDLFLPRNPGENDVSYKKRALYFGRQFIKGYIYK